MGKRIYCHACYEPIRRNLFGKPRIAYEPHSKAAYHSETGCTHAAVAGPALNSDEAMRVTMYLISHSEAWRLLGEGKLEQPADLEERLGRRK